MDTQYPELYLDIVTQEITSDMKSKNRLWVILAAFMVLLLAACLLPPLPWSRTRPSRITGANSISSFSMTNSNALTTAAPSK